MAILALVAALWGHEGDSHSYFLFIRWVIFLSSIGTSMLAYRWQRHSFLYLFVGLAALFNPILPIYFHSRSTWMLVDSCAIVLFIWFLLAALNKFKPLATP